MNTWKKKEDNLFNKLKSEYIPDLTWSGAEYSHYDCFSKEKNVDIELKCRNVHYDDLLIEKMKYDHLMNRAKANNTVPVYISETPKGIFGFNLNLLPEPNWELRNMPKTSHFSNKQYIKKAVGYLNVNQSKKLN